MKLFKDWKIKIEKLFSTPISIKKLVNYWFYLLLFSIPFNFRHILNFEQVKNIEGFRENISFSFYFFDLIFIITLLFFLSICLSRKDSPSQLKKITNVNYKLKIILSFFIFTLLLSAYFSKNQPASFYNSFRITEATIFFLLAWILLKNKKVLKNSIFIIFLSGIFQSTIALIQFIIQKSIGLKFLGESIIAVDVLGVAKIEIYGDKIIRAYGTFPHPNLLGAFLLLSLACGIYLAMFNKNHLSLKEKSAKKNLFSKNLLINKLSLLIILWGILITFSRSIWLATFLFVATILSLVSFNYWSVLNNKIKKQNFKIWKFIVAIIFIISILLFFSPRLCVTNCPGDESFALRKIYSQTARNIIRNHLAIGIGPGNFISFSNSTNYQNGLKPWETQPVHNLYLLIAGEIGLVGLITFLFFILFNLLSYLKAEHSKFIQDSKKRLTASANTNIFLFLFLSFLFLGFFDHYFWTLPQGQFLFWLSLALAVNKITPTNKNHP